MVTGILLRSGGFSTVLFCFGAVVFFCVRVFCHGHRRFAWLPAFCFGPVVFFLCGYRRFVMVTGVFAWLPAFFFGPVVFLRSCSVLVPLFFFVCVCFVVVTGIDRDYSRRNR